MRELPEPVALKWDGPDDKQNPFNWSRSKRWTLTITACTATLLVALNNTSITVAAAEIDARFSIDESSFPHSYWLVTSWNAGSAIVPLFALPLMEDIGVRYGYIWGCAGILISVLGGIIGDIWDGPEQRSIPMSIYVWLLVSGLSLGPTMAGAIIRYLYWRWILYIEAIIYFSAFPLFLFLIKETRHSVILLKRAKKREGSNSSEKRIRKSSQFWKEAVIRPLTLLVSEWVIFSFTLWSSFSLGTVFLFTQSVGQVYTTLYSWPESSCGLVQSAFAIGGTVGMLAQFYQDRLYFRSAQRNTESPGSPIPEARLYLSILGSLVVSAGFFVYAWTSFSTVHWIAPTTGLAIVGFGIYTVVLAVAMYVTDSYAKYAASALAGVAMGENVVAAFLPLSTMSMYTNLGFQWASSLLGFVALAMTLIPVALLFYGQKIRSKSPFMVNAAY